MPNSEGSDLTEPAERSLPLPRHGSSIRHVGEFPSTHDAVITMHHPTCPPAPCSLPLVALAAACGTFCSAQVAWTQATTPLAPSARVKHRMVFDSARNVVVLFGGDTTAQTWEWNGTAWTQRLPATSPVARQEHGMAYDSWRQRVVVFGGTGNQVLGDTWEYDGVTWQLRTPPTSPTPRWAHAMTFDETRGVVVMHGGASGGGMSDTWEYDGNTWTQRFPTTNPPREEHAMTFDSHRGRVVLFGGRDGGTMFTQTLEWDGNNWLVQPTATNPPPRTHYSLAYDASRQRTVLFGGFPGLLGDTWEWDGATWLQRSPLAGPQPRQQHAIVFDAARGEVVLFGGSTLAGAVADTWRYAPTNPASYVPFGGGCAGGTGAPVLVADPNSLPWIGHAFVRVVDNLPPASPAFVIAGFSNTSWGGGSLPLSLQALGMPGCLLLVAPDVVLAMTTVGTSAHLTLNIPNNSALLGLSFYDQSLVLDAQANPFGAVVSNGAIATVGGK